MISRIVLCFSILFTCSALAKDVVVEANGYGPTKEIAIESALIRAMSQVQGVSVDSHTLRQANQIKVNGESITAIAMANTTAMKTKGQIKSYQVLDSQCEQECEVLLSVTVPVYKSPGLAPVKRRKLAVSPFAGKNGQVFSSNLQTLLVQSRRFAVLEHEYTGEYK